MNKTFYKKTHDKKAARYEHIMDAGWRDDAQFYNAVLDYIIHFWMLINYRNKTLYAVVDLILVK